MFFAPVIGAVSRMAVGFASRASMVVTRGLGRSMTRHLMKDFMDPGNSQISLPRFSVKSNIGDTRRWLNDFNKQMPFAVAKAPTRTARRLVPIMEAEVKNSFHQPKPFTVRAFGTTPATKYKLSAVLFVKDKQANYLRPNIEGGGRAQKTFERRLESEANADGYWAPGEGLRLTAAGNMTLAQIKQIAAGLRKEGKYSEVFVGVPAGHPGAPFGIWARGRRGRGKKSAAGIKPLLVQIKHPSYKKRFDFFGLAEKNVQRIFDEEFSKAFREAQRGIRPISPRCI